MRHTSSKCGHVTMCLAKLNSLWLSSVALPVSMHTSVCATSWRKNWSNPPVFSDVLAGLFLLIFSLSRTRLLLPILETMSFCQNFIRRVAGPASGAAYLAASTLFLISGDNNDDENNNDEVDDDFSFTILALFL